MTCGSCSGAIQSFADIRREKCKACTVADWSEDKGICLPTAAKHGVEKADIEHGIQRAELWCPNGEWGQAETVCGRCGRDKQLLHHKHLVCKWCVIKYNLADPKKPASRVAVAPATRSATPRGNSFRETGEAQWVSLQQLAHDIQLLASSLPPDITAVVGVARSGITPASILASLLHLPLLSIRQTRNDVIEVGNGWRLGGSDHVSAAKSGKVVIVDDTVMTGNSLRAIAATVQREFPNAITAALYVNPLAKKKPDIWVRDLGWPHLLEWNIFNSVLSPNVAVDFDGILCHDCPYGSDDDGPRYLDFIRHTKPLYVPRKVPIPLIVTARIEKYRAETEAWLARHRIAYHQLVMHPAATLSERNRDDIAAYKASHFGEWAKHHVPRPAPLMFIESDDRQARRIAALTGHLVVCPATSGIYRNTNGLPDQIDGVPLVSVPVMWDAVATPTNKRLVIAVAGSDEIERQAEITAPLMEEYAKRHDADFVLLTGNQAKEHGMLNKYRIQPFIDHYDQTLYLDCDVIVKPDAPSVFDKVPVGEFAAIDEWQETIANGFAEINQKELNVACDLIGVPRFDVESVANTGVMVLPRGSAIYKPPLPQAVKSIGADQQVVAAKLRGKWHRLDRRFNWCWFAPDFWEGLNSAYFIHTNGCTDQSYRLDLLRRLSSGNYVRFESDELAWKPRWKS